MPVDESNARERPGYVNSPLKRTRRKEVIRVNTHHKFTGCCGQTDIEGSHEAKVYLVFNHRHSSLVYQRQPASHMDAAVSGLVVDNDHVYVDTQLC